MKLYLHLSILKRFRKRILNPFCTAVTFGIRVNCVTTHNLNFMVGGILNSRSRSYVPVGLA